MYLDYLTPVNVKTQFKLGVNGYLGIDDAFVTHKGKFYGNALGAHAPSVVEYDLDGSYNTFECEVAINDIVDKEICNPVNFSVYADGRLVAYVPRVRAHEPSRTIYANINGAKKLTLNADVVYDGYNNWCQAVWLSPQIHSDGITKILSVFRDTEFESRPLAKSKKCLFTVADFNMTKKLHRMLDSYFMYNSPEDTTVVIFVVGDTELINPIAKKFKATVIPYEMTQADDLPITSVVTALGINEVVDADAYLYLSPCMTVADDLNSLYSGLDLLDDEKLMVCNSRMTNIVGYSLKDIVSFPSSIYGGNGKDWEYLRLDGIQQYYQMVADPNVMLFTPKSLLALKHVLTEMMPTVVLWRNAAPEILEIRESATISCAIAKISMSAELDHIYNYQPNINNVDNISVDMHQTEPLLMDNSRGKRIKIIRPEDIFAAKYPQFIHYYDKRK